MPQEWGSSESGALPHYRIDQTAAKFVTHNLGVKVEDLSISLISG